MTNETTSWTATLVAVRTKTGNKAHIAGAGSTRTYCGAKVAMRIRGSAAGLVPCAACGCSADLLSQLTVRS